jgi:hypothetical protein
MKLPHLLQIIFVYNWALATDITDFTGSTTGEALPGVALVYSENRPTGWVDQVILTPVCKWNAENVAIWEAEIPASYITLSKGNATLQISGTGMKMVTIPLTIGNTGCGGLEVITGYTHNATAKTIDTKDTTLKVEQIEEIYNLTRYQLIYTCSDPSRASISISDETPGVINYTYSGTMTNGDKIRIVKNPT